MDEFIKKLIERLEEELKTAREMQTTQCIGHDGYGTPLQSKLGGEICALLKVQNIVNELAEEYNNGWIACTERLPEESGEYLTYVEYAGDKFIAIDECFCGGILKEWNCTPNYRIIAWMPLPTLPAPYTEGESR